MHDGKMQSLCTLLQALVREWASTPPNASIRSWQLMESLKDCDWPDRDGKFTLWTCNVLKDVETVSWFALL